MNRRIFLTSAAGLAACSRSGDRTLNVLNWSAYIAPETIPDFEKEFQARVHYSVYESNEEMLAKVASGNSGYDVAFPSNYFVAPMRSAGLLAPLDHAQLSGLANLSPQFQKPQWDPDLQHAIPYMWGTTGIAYRASAPFEPTAWASLWDPRFKGRMTMLDDPAEVLGAALKKLGYSLNSEDPAELAEAQQEAVAQKKLLRAYLNAEVRDQLAAGDVLAAQLWATTAAQAMAGAPQVRFAYPSEGFPLYADNVVVLAESRRRELAYQFVNYLLRPQVAAAIALKSRTATANAKAFDLLPPEAQQNTALYPPAPVLARGEWFAHLSPETQKLRDRLWTEIKSA